MLYAIFCYDAEAVTCSWSKERDAEVMASLAAVQRPLVEQRRLGPVARLMPTTTAVTIRKGKEAMVMDGPFAETKEQLLGFYVVDVATLDDAVEIAKDLAKASGSGGAYELRPIMTYRSNTTLAATA
ncbi:MAG: YciI family protein [Deltaproteobacteria bacterium]|nr:YciI family protein [Deltaproteobacteria bacterium]